MNDLILHVNSDAVSREALAVLPRVESTPYFQPIQHIELVEGIEKALDNKGLKIQDEKLGLRRDGAMLFGVMKVGYQETQDFVTTLGFRQALDRSMSIQMIAGVSVFVCDNMAFSGSSIILRQKHSWRFSLAGELSGAVSRWQQKADSFVVGIDFLKSQSLTNTEAKAMICDAFAQGIMPLRFLPDVVHEYLKPRHEEFAPRTAWSLQNSFTEVQKQMPLTTRMVASQDIGKFFKLAA
jgi:hypothetical protein